jgi:hypothetical protein
MAQNVNQHALSRYLLRVLKSGDYFWLGGAPKRLNLHIEQQALDKVVYLFLVKYLEMPIWHPTCERTLDELLNAKVDL